MSLMHPVPGLAEIQAETLGDPKIKIALLDGPVELSHPCFQGARLSTVQTLVSGQAAGGTASAHGTHIASILFGQPGSDVVGIAPHCQGVILPVFSDSIDGSALNCSQLDLARAITQAVQLGVHIINISGGEITPSGQANSFLTEAVKRCAENNILIVAAAGNEGCECFHMPAALPSVLAVGAMDEHGSPMNSSNWGEIYRTQGLLAPGKDITGAAIRGGTITKTGTSFATPIVTGAAALLLSLQRKSGQPPYPLLIRDLLLETAFACDPAEVINCSRYLRGRINIAEAYRQIQEKALTQPSHAGKGVEMQEDTSGAQSPQQTSHAVGRVEMSETHYESSPIKFVTAHDSHQLTLRETGPMTEKPPDIQVTPEVPMASLPPQRPTSHNMVRPSEAALALPSPAEEAAKVFVLGTLGYDFGTDARRDWFAEVMGAQGESAGGTPAVPADMLRYLKTGYREPSQPRTSYAPSLIWTLNLEATPIYAIYPNGPFAAVVYQELIDLLDTQIQDDKENRHSRIAVPGVIYGQVMLRSGQVVPIIVPDLRGLRAVRASENLKDKLLERLFYELRNLGLTAQDRAMNAIAASAINVSRTIADKEEIESIRVERTPVARPGSDCWDVIITVFDPSNILEHARKVLRQTVDVSDVIPVRLGNLREWSIY